MYRFRFIGLALWLALTTCATSAQTLARRDSLRRLLLTLPNDTNRVMALNQLSYDYYLTKPDSSYILAQEGYELARHLNYVKGQAQGLNRLSAALLGLGDYPKARRFLEEARALSAKVGDSLGVARSVNNTADLYMRQGQWAKALPLMQQAYTLYKKLPTAEASGLAIILSNIGECHLNLRRLDSAVYYLRLAMPLAQRASQDILGTILYNLGDVALLRKQYSTAYNYYRQSMAASALEQAYFEMYEACYRLANLFARTGPPDSTRHYARQALQYAQQGSYMQGILKSSQQMAALYKGRDDSQALRYYEMAVAAKDSLYSQEKVRQLVTFDFEEQQKAREIEVAKAAYRSRVWQYVLGGVLLVMAGVAGLLLRNNRQKQRANALLQRQRDEIQAQRSQLAESLDTLQATQAQLVQKEKLASLGELTAGIAHEIQNPLNFVNNFADVSTELVDELKEELASGNVAEADELANDLKQNLTKISQHGQRASGIVQGMLQHSRASTGQKEPTDLNALADEYLRLSYHGLRAKDKTDTSDRFNATFKTDFDATLPRVNVVAQDIGRVLLNLYNNAFYAVGPARPGSRFRQERSKQSDDDYVPTVTVRTERSGQNVVISVSDNGMGMPESVKAKIFQPFFTTKPAGQGTGLGLSLSYDIITKGHGGTLDVTTEPGQGTTFTIRLPVLV